MALTASAERAAAHTLDRISPYLPYIVLGLIAWWLLRRVGDALSSATESIGGQIRRPTVGEAETLKPTPTGEFTSAGVTGRILDPANNGTASRTIGGVLGSSFGAGKYPATVKLNVPRANRYLVEYIADEYYRTLAGVGGGHSVMPVAQKTLELAAGEHTIPLEIPTDVGLLGADVVAELRVDGRTIGTASYYVR